MSEMNTLNPAIELCETEMNSIAGGGVSIGSSNGDLAVLNSAAGKISTTDPGIGELLSLGTQKLRQIQALSRETDSAAVERFYGYDS